MTTGGSKVRESVSWRDTKKKGRENGGGSNFYALISSQMNDTTSRRRRCYQRYMCAFIFDVVEMSKYQILHPSFTVF